MTSTVLVLGARGRLGMAVAQAFANAGWRVIGQIRPGATASLPGVQWLSIDLQDTAALAQAAQGARVVVHALNPPYPKWQQEVPGLMEAAIRVTRALDACLMFPGNVYNFGEDMPEILTEDTPQRPSARKGHLRVAVEHRLAASGVRSVVIRAGDFFGSGTGSWFDLALAKDITKGRMTYPGSMELATPWAYLPDLARSFVAVADRLVREPQSLPWHASFCYAGHSLSGRDWARLLEAVARERGWLAPGQALKIGGMPWGVIRALRRFVPMFRELAEMRYLWQKPHALNGSRLEAFIGAQPATPLPQAVRMALAGLGKA